MRRAARTVRGPAAVTGAVLVLAACGSPDVTPARLDAAVASTFASLYVRQQAMLGHHGVTRSWASPQARCAPPGVTATQGSPTGSPSDWVCTLVFRAGDGTVTTAELDVRTRAEGCFSASGPATLLGPAVMELPDGGSGPNPALAFDGCFDPME